MVQRLGVEGEGKVAAFGGVEVLLHQAKRDARTGGEAFGQRHRLVHQLGRIDGTVHDAKPLGFFAQDHVGEEVELFRLRDADELREEVGAAEIAREADLGERRRDLRALGGDAEVAGERDGEAGAGSGTRNGRDGDLRHVVQPARDFHALAQAVGGFFGRAAVVGAAFCRGKPLHVSACAERTAGARNDNGADRAVSRKARQRLKQAVEHGVGEGVARLGAVQREDGDAVLNGFQQIGHVRFPRASFVLFDEG